MIMVITRLPAGLLHIISGLAGPVRFGAMDRIAAEIAELIAVSPGLLIDRLVEFTFGTPDHIPDHILPAAVHGIIGMFGQL